MIRKTLLGLVAAATLMAGLVPAAEAKVFVSIGVGHQYGYYNPYYRHHCSWKTVSVKVWSQKKHRWVYVKKLRRICW